MVVIVGAKRWSSLLKPGNPDSDGLAPGFSQTRCCRVVLLPLLPFRFSSSVSSSSRFAARGWAMVKGRESKRERWKTTEDLPGEKTYRDLARERNGRPLTIFQGRRPIEIFWRGREMEDRCRSSRGEDLGRSSGEGERWKTVVDLPGEKTYRDLLARTYQG